MPMRCFSFLDPLVLGQDFRLAPKKETSLYFQLAETEKCSMKKMIKIVIAASSALIFSCSTQPKDLRQPSNLSITLRDSKPVQFFDISTLNSKIVRYTDYNLNKEEELRQLELDAISFLDEYKRRKNGNIESDGSQFVESVETEKPYNEFDFTDKSLKEAFTYTLKMLDQIRENHNPLEAKLQIAQIARAIQQKYTPPLRTNFELLKAPIYLVQYFSSPRIDMHGKAVDDSELEFLRHQLVQEQDISKLNYIDHLKFKDMPQTCQYLKAKKGYGAHAGFQIICGDQEYKIKFGSELNNRLGNERYSGPFNTRIYRALGYLAPHINYFSEIKVDYDRKVMTEFNSRALEYFSFSVVGIPIYTVSNNKFFDPFMFINGVILKNGQFVDAQTARKNLLPSLVEESHNTSSSDVKTAAITDDLINPEFENQIAQFVFSDTTLTLKNDKDMGEEIGPWKPKDLMYGDLKEVRGIMVLAAWSGNFDVRKDNLRLNLVKNRSTDKKELRLLFGDSGSGLGKAVAIGKTSSAINDMLWTVTKKTTTTGPGKQQTRQTTLWISGLINLEPSSIFQEIEMSDAQWMLTKICKFSKTQIQDMLITSGLSAAEVALATSKLLERRNQMISDFDMESSLANSCHSSVNQNLNYDPRNDGEIFGISSHNNQKVQAPFRNQIVINGKIVNVTN